jgi:glycosyltransferase involved in cell wall biosynthesis
MKILVVAPYLAAVYGGPSKCIMEFAEALGEQGMDVDLVTTNDNRDGTLEVKTETWIASKKCRIQYFHSHSVLGRKLSFRLTRWLFKHIGDYDIVSTHSIFSFPMLTAYWACWFRGIPYVVTPHGMLKPEALRIKSLRKSLYLPLIEKPWLQAAAAIQVLTEQEAQGVVTLGIVAPTLLVPNGLPRQSLETSISSNLFFKSYEELRGREIILFLGRLDPIKGLDLLVAAFNELANDYPNAHLVLAGPDSIGYGDTLRKAFVRDILERRVTFTGLLDGDMKLSVLAATSVYVAPSYSEGFSLSILEAMAARLPCIISRNCNFPEAAEAQAVLEIPNSVFDLIGAIKWSLQNKDAANQMGQRAHALIKERYTWDTLVNRSIGAFRQIIEGH